MSDFSVHAVVLRATNYRESDRMLTLLSSELGRMEIIARGCRKTTSRLLAASQIFASGEFQLSERKGKHSLRSAMIHDAFFPIASDYDVLQNAVYAARWCLRVAQPSQPADELVTLFLSALSHYAYSEMRPGCVTAVFLTHLARVLGVQPVLEGCAVCGQLIPVNHTFLWDHSKGGIVCAACASPQVLFIEAEYVKEIRDILSSKDPFANRAPDDIMRGVRGLLMQFLEYMLQ